MPVKDTIEGKDDITIDFEAEVKRLQVENEHLKKSIEQLQKEVQDQAARYAKLFQLFANNIDFYLGNK